MDNSNSQKSFNPNTRLVSLKTDLLQMHLNRLYGMYRTNQNADRVRIFPAGEEHLFDCLWDLKETAIMQGRTAVEMPEEWLKELEAGTQVNNLVNIEAKGKVSS